MAYLTRIGHIPENKGKLGSRGYSVFRRGTTVWALWGPVKVLRESGMVRFEWERVQRLPYRCRTLEAARLKLDEILRRQEAQGYVRLPPNTGISRRAQTKVVILRGRKG